MIVELECLPSPSGTADNRYAFVEAAIAVIERAGLRYAVSPLGTTFEGPPDRVWAVLREAHEACLAAGAQRLVSVVKIAEAADAGDLTMDGLTAKYRDHG